MAIRFRKSIKLGKLFKLNVSKSGVSVTAGKNGASVNVGKTGVYLNANPSIVGIKKTGLSFRQKLFGFSSRPIKKSKDNEEPENPLFDEVIEGLEELGYKKKEIEKVLPTIKQYNFDNSSDYIKEALKLLNNNI